MSRFPSGRNKGQRWVNSPRAESTVVSSVGGPPDAAIFQSPVLALGAKIMTPWAFQVPPRGLDAGARVTMGPPATSSRWSLPLAKKPMDLESGDQNGY